LKTLQVVGALRQELAEAHEDNHHQRTVFAEKNPTV
jgi:hypothetical protein